MRAVAAEMLALLEAEATEDSDKVLRAALNTLRRALKREDATEASLAGSINSANSFLVQIMREDNLNADIAAKVEAAQHVRREGMSGRSRQRRTHSPQAASESGTSEKEIGVESRPPVAKDFTGTTIYCDGGCWPNPGRGGWGVCYRNTKGEWVDAFGGEDDTTNNRMELTAAIRAAEIGVELGGDILIRSDSQYIVKGVTDWMYRWQRSGWRKKGKESPPVKNQDLWKLLWDLAQQHRPQWEWVKGHAGDEGNERADMLAERNAPQWVRDASRRK